MDKNKREVLDRAPVIAAHPGADPHFDACQHLLHAAQQFWDACKNAKQLGAVQWLEGSGGELLIYTRSEYRQALMANIHKLGQEPKRFDADQQAAGSVEAALAGLLRRYVGLANSGDAGNWDPETEDEVIAARAALDSRAQPVGPAAFKNFHRALCARFGYTHDEQFWWRDLVSLEEHIAARAQPVADEELRRDVLAMAELLSNHEWADHVCTDPDAELLAAQISAAIAQPVAAGELPQTVKTALDFGHRALLASQPRNINPDAWDRHEAALNMVYCALHMPKGLVQQCADSRPAGGMTDADSLKRAYELGLHADHQGYATLAASVAQPAPGFPERDQSKPAEQQGLFRKFTVTRTDGSDQPGGKHYGCRYYVLDLTHDQHAPAAMRAYAASCADTHPQLSADIVAEFGAQVQAQPVASGYTLDQIADACMEAEIPDSKYESLAIALAAAPAQQADGGGGA